MFDADPSRILFDYADILCYDDGSAIYYNMGWSYLSIINTLTGIRCKHGHIIDWGNKACESYVVDASKDCRLGWRNNHKSRYKYCGYRSEWSDNDHNG